MRAFVRKDAGVWEGSMLPDGHLLWSFSTRGMALEARIAALRNLREWGTLPIEPLPGWVAQAEISRWTFGNVGVILGELGGLRQVVPAHAREFRDEVFFGVNIAGMAVASQGGREVTVKAGEAVLFSSAETGFTSSRPRSSRFLGLRLPHRTLAPLVPNLDRHSMRLIPGQTQSLRLLVDYLCLLGSRQLPGSADLDRAISTHILDLIALSVGAHPDAMAQAQNRGVRAARLQAIKADVSSRFREGDLSVAAVAARHSITPRYIHKLFETEGATFSEYLLARRLDLAHRLLTDRHLVGRPVTSIALDAGFSDLSYFNRMFRRRYNATPTEVRAAECS
jgi:AraC-like DNA-binding protein